MADKVDKPKKKAKAKKDDKGVLAALPSTRPERIGSRRAAAAVAKPAATTSTTTAEAATTAKPTTTARRAATGKRKPAAKAKRTTAKAASRPTATRRKAAAPRTFEPTQAAESAAGAADERAAGATPSAGSARDRTYPRPRPVREGAPGIGTGGYRDQSPSESARPSGVEIASAAVKAAGEVAQFGITLGGKALKRVVDRLPKP